VGILLESVGLFLVVLLEYRGGYAIDSLGGFGDLCDTALDI
jgi:hypothetical protein